MNPLISIVIPCYNSADCVSHAIDSALVQTYPNVEVVVIDDGSTDGSLEVIRSFGDKIRWETGPNRGGCAARNRGVELATGELIQFLDADDVLFPDKLALQVKVALEHRSHTVYCDYERRLLDGQKQAAVYHHFTEDPVILMLRTLVLTSCPLHWKSSLAGVGGFRVGLRASQEWDLHLRLACNGVQFYHMPGILYAQCERHESVSASGLRCVETRIETTCDAFRRLKTQGDLTESRARTFAVRMARDGQLLLVHGGEKMAAAKCFETAREMHPSGGITSDFGSWTDRAVYRLLGPSAVVWRHTWRRRMIDRLLGKQAKNWLREKRNQLRQYFPPPALPPTDRRI